MSLAHLEADTLDAAVARLVSSTIGEDATDGLSSGVSDGSGERERKRPRPRPAPRRKQKKRGKPTYYIRKDEIDTLQEQVQKLQQELAQLKAGPTIDNGALGDATKLRTLYATEIERNNLVLAGTQSMISSSSLSMLDATASVPLKTFIHLPIDLQKRDEFLASMREQKLQAASRYMAERTRFLDLRVSHRQGECFHLPNGDAVNTGFDVIPFTSGHSLRQVYEEFQFFLSNQEMAISEQLGVLTIRESEDVVDFKYGHSRFLSTILGGVEVESNVAMFMECVDGTDASPGFAIGTTDFVDQDDLYPRRTNSCGRKEMTGAVMFVEVPTPNGPVVSLCRWSYIRFRGPTGSMEKTEQAAVRDVMAGMCDFMPKIMAQRLAQRPPAR